jgi:RNA polymerase sigma-70 factor (ECF subfamily)
MERADFDLPEHLRRLREGDEAAARELFREYYPYVASIVRAHLPRRTEEEDLVQMTFVKAFAHLDGFHGGSYKHWLARIAVNTCLNALRSEQRRPEVRLADLGDDGSRLLETLRAGAGDLPTSEAASARELVETVLATLSAPERLVVTLLHLEERPMKEVAAITGWSTPVIKVRAFRARQKLRKALEVLSNEQNP